MQNFTISPTDTLTKLASFVRQDGSPSNLQPTIHWSVDKPTLARVQQGGIGVPLYQVVVVPILPAANQGGVVTITAEFTNENGVSVKPSFTVTIAVDSNPTTDMVLQ